MKIKSKKNRSTYDQVRALFGSKFTKKEYDQAYSEWLEEEGSEWIEDKGMGSNGLGGIMKAVRLLFKMSIVLVMCSFIFVSCVIMSFVIEDDEILDLPKATNTIWQSSDYPLNVCVKTTDFSKKTNQAIKRSITIWNTQYKAYIDNNKILGAPKSLFVYSCKAYNKHPVILFMKVKWTNKNKSGQFLYFPLQKGDYYAAIHIAEFAKMKIPLFLHELGHAMDLPHFKADKSKIMYPCAYSFCEGENCLPEDLLFKYFLKSIGVL